MNSRQTFSILAALLLAFAVCAMIVAALLLLGVPVF